MSRAGVGRNGIDGKHCRSAVGGTDGALRERCRWHSRGADGSTDGARLERGWSADGGTVGSAVGGADGARLKLS